MDACSKDSIVRPIICECGDELWNGHDDRRHRERHRNESHDRILRYGLCGNCDLGLPMNCTCKVPE